MVIVSDEDDPEGNEEELTLLLPPQPTKIKRVTVNSHAENRTYEAYLKPHIERAPGTIQYNLDQSNN